LLCGWSGCNETLLLCQRGGVFGGVGADVGKARGILRAGLLAGVGTGPASALLEFRRVVAGQIANGDDGRRGPPSRHQCSH